MRILASLFLTMAVYTTTFPANEDPISEGGVWFQNNTNRAKVLTTGGNAFGKGTNNDGYAGLAGFGDSVIETTVFRDAALSDADGNSYEVEHLHRLTDTAGTTACYELDFAFSGGDPIIVLWSGATSFVVLSGLVKDANFWPDGAGGQLRNGYKIKSETVLLPSPRINFYCDSGSGYVLYGHYIFGADAVNDAVPLATGDPAISFFTTLGSSNLLGFSDVTITSPASLTGRAIGSSQFHPGRSPGLGGISSARFKTNWWPYTFVPPAAFDPALMSAMEKHGNDPLVLPPQVVASGMTPPEEMPT